MIALMGIIEAGLYINDIMEVSIISCLSLHAKIMCYLHTASLWLHDKSHLFHWCFYETQNITFPLVDMNFIISCSTQYLTRLIKFTRMELEREGVSQTRALGDFPSFRISGDFPSFRLLGFRGIFRHSVF